MFALLPILAVAQERRFAYSGTIGDEFGIAMQLTFNGTHVQGHFSYRNQHQWLRVKGSFVAPKLFLQERSFNEKTGMEEITGSFDATLLTDSTFRGTWKKNSESKVFTFSMTQEKFRDAPQTLFIESVEYSPKGCDCFRGTLFKITDDRVSTFVLNTLLVALNNEVIHAQRECPCDDSERGLTALSRRIIFNEKMILSCAETISATAAYSWTSVSYVNFNVRTGKQLSAIELFKPESVPAVKNYVSQIARKHLDEAIGGRSDTSEREIIQKLGQTALETALSQSRLYDFYLTTDGLVFEFPWAFPHAEAALQPTTAIAVPERLLREWIDPKGPLAGY